MDNQQTLDLPEDVFDEALALAAASRQDAADLKRWPARLLEIVDVLESELKRLPAGQDARQIAEHLAFALAHNQGGRPLYLPASVKNLEAVTRARRIYNSLGTPSPDGGHWSIEQLAVAHGIAVSTAYADYALIKGLESARRQPKLL